MTGFILDPMRRARAVQYLLLGWRPDDIAQDLHCDRSTIYRMQCNLWMYNSPYRPRCQTTGCPRKMTKRDEDLLIQFLARNPTANQEEMRWFLWEECGIRVSQSTISRFLNRVKWSRKKARRVSKQMSLALRRAYLADLADIRAEQMVFLDESLFNEVTGWRLMAWAPIGVEGRYLGDRTRGSTWSVLAAYSTTGYLPCVVVREGYFNTEAFVQWVTEDLLPHCNAYPGPNSVIIMDNASSHCNPAVEEAILAKGCQVRYLPPYSPDLNPIELSWSVLKAWVRRHFHELWPTFEGSFGDFLLMCVARSRCDRFAEAHFRHSGNRGYIFVGDIEKFERRLRVFERGSGEGEMEF
jgi:transposase